MWIEALGKVHAVYDNLRTCQRRNVPVMLKTCSMINLSACVNGTFRRSITFSQVANALSSV